MRGKGPSKPVPQEVARPVGTSLGPGDGGPVILHPRWIGETLLTLWFPHHPHTC